MTEHAGPLFSVSEFTTYHLTLEEEVEMLTRLGVAAIDVAERKLSPDPVTAKRQLREVLESGLEVSGFVPRVHAVLPDSLSPEVTEPAVRADRFTASMEFVRDCFPDDAPVILTITGAARQQDYAAASALIVDTYTRHARTAAALGLTIAFEPLNPVFMNTDTTVCSWANAVRLCAVIDQATFRLAFDTWHVWDEFEITQQLDRSFELVATIHVSDWLAAGPRAFGDRGIPGDGIIDWADLAAVVAAHHYDGPMMLEIFSEDHLENSLWTAPAAEVIERSRAFLARTFAGLR